MDSSLLEACSGENPAQFCLLSSKANFTDPGLWGRKSQTAFITGYQARRMGSSCLKDLKLRSAFGVALKATFGMRVVGGMNFSD